MKTHYRLSPSGMERTLNCPGSLVLQDGLPDVETSAAAEGTRAHGMGEDAVQGKPVVINSPEDQEMFDSVKVYVDEVNAYRAAKEVHIELTEVTVEHLTIEGLGGTCDHAMIYTDDNGEVVLHIFDFKYGTSEVEAVENMQLLSYFAIWRSRFGVVVDRYRGTIVQPRGQGDWIKTWDTTTERVLEHEARIKAMVASSDRPFKVGPWCKYCKAITICEEMQKNAIETAQLEFTDLVKDKERLVRLYEILPALKALIEKVPQAMLEKFKEGETLEGFKVVERLSHRRWSLSQEETVRVLEQLGLGVNDYSEIKLRSPAQVEKKLGKKQAKAVLPDLCRRFTTGYSVVPESSRGEAVDLSQADFSILEDVENVED